MCSSLLHDLDRVLTCIKSSTVYCSQRIDEANCSKLLESAGGVPVASGTMAAPHPTSSDTTAGSAGGVRCPTCGYRAQWRDGVLVHEGAAFFAVIMYGCDQPQLRAALLGEPTPAGGDISAPLPAGVDAADLWTLLRARAAGVLTRHTSTSTSSLCACCGHVWPCQAAVTAEHNLAAF